MFKALKKLLSPKKVTNTPTCLYLDKVHLMLDIETMGNNPNSPITSIGAVVFNPSTGDLKEEFSCKVDLIDSCKYGRMDSDTVLWWLKKSKEHTPEFLEGELLTLLEALTKLDAFIKQLGKKSNILVWGNGCDFDNIIVEEAYSALELEAPWSHWNNQSVRTAVLIGKDILGIDPKNTLKFNGEEHKALDDAKHQARYVSIIWEQLEAISERAKIKEHIRPEELNRVIDVATYINTISDMVIDVVIDRTDVTSDLDSYGRNKAEKITLNYIENSKVIHTESFDASQTKKINESYLIKMVGYLEITSLNKGVNKPKCDLPKILKVKDIGKIPSHRYKERICGNFLSGEEFRDEWLIPNIEKHGKVVVQLDGVLGYGSPWLEEVFGGLVRKSLVGKKRLCENQLQRIMFIKNSIVSDDTSLVLEVGEYIDTALSYQGKGK